METPDIQKLSTGIHFSQVSGGIYETTKSEVEPEAGQRQYAAKPWARWGTDNNYPQRLIDAVMTDPIATAIERRIAMHWGKGTYFYRRKIDAGKEIIEPLADEELPAQIQDFFFENDFNNFMQGIIADFEWWHSFCVQYISKGSGQITAVKWQRMKDVRSELRDFSKFGQVDGYYLSAMWPDPQETEYKRVPAFDLRGNGSGIYRHQLVSIDKDYNPQPAWHSITRWLYVASKIPRWILANIDNSINIKYHVKIPLEYFLKRHPIEAYKTAEERNEAIRKDEEALYKKIDEYLAGEKNVSKAFYSKVAVDDHGNALPGWEIIPLDNKIQHDAWLQAYGTAAMAMVSGVGLSASIAGAVLPNGLGSGSGSDMREQFNFYTQVMTSIPRQTTLEPWEIIKRRNKWPADIHLGFRDVIFQSTDQAKSGFVKDNEQSPTADSQ
jgi:hypothetical protein